MSRHSRRAPVRRAVTWLVALTALAGLGLAIIAGISSANAAPDSTGGSAAAAGGAPPAPPVAISSADADRGAALVAAEDRRLLDIRTVSTLARWQNRAQKAPYRLSTPEGYTLVLTARSAVYTFADLLKLQPQTLLRLSDGSYLLTEHIVVLAGAELDLARPNGLNLHLASSAEGFVSIVSMGGRLKVVGTVDHPVRINSWDEGAAVPDTKTGDGRAYIRAVGGQLQISYAEISDLGFWSGRTGGVSLTGTNRPNTGALSADSPSSGSAGVPYLPGSVGNTKVLPAGKLPSTDDPTTPTRQISPGSVSSRAASTTPR